MTRFDRAFLGVLSALWLALGTATVTLEERRLFGFYLVLFAPACALAAAIATVIGAASPRRRTHALVWATLFLTSGFLPFLLFVVWILAWTS